MKLFLKLLSSLLLFNLLFANIEKVSLDKFYPPSNLLKGSNAVFHLTIPTANRWKIKNVTLHIEYSPSKALVKQRSNLSLFFNGVLVYKKRLDPDIDVYKDDIKIPIGLLQKFNDLTIKASQHYCMNCCENGASSELWTSFDWKSSYVKFNFDLKPIKSNFLLYRDYVIDYGTPTNLKFGILTEDKSDFYLTQGAKISGYLGSVIKYRKVIVENISSLLKNEDIFIIGSSKFVKKLLNLKKVEDNVFILPNPFNKNYAIIVLTADTKTNLSNTINSFISIKPSLLFGKNIDIQNILLPKIKAYDSPKLIPLDKKVYISDLGYNDFKMFNPNYQYDIEFNVPIDLFRYNHYDFTFHLFYNYNQGIRKDSVINIYLNNKFLTALKVDKDYGTILEDKKLKIPVYLLNPGKNKITIQYGFMPTGQGHCVNKNFYELSGTIFAKKSYIDIPNLPHWTKMPFMEYFTTEAFPFSVYPDLKETQIFISNKKDDTISALYTLCGYIGEKTLIPPYNIDVISDVNNLKNSKHIIALGNMLPTEFFKNLPIKISNESIQLKIPVLKKLSTLLQKELLGQNSDLESIINLKNSLNEETIFTFGKSPYNENKAILAIISPRSNELFKSIENLYKIKFVSKIKGNIAIVDYNTNKVVSTKIGGNFYLGHLPFFDYILFKLGFSPLYLILYTVLIIILIVIILKILLDFREKRRMKNR